MSGFRAGDEIPFLSGPALTQAHLNAYAKASGDPNRIHLDESVAKSMGLPGVIAHGMLSAAFLAERGLAAVLESHTHRAFRPIRFQARFKAMVFLGDRISVGGTVKEATESGLVLELQARNQKGEAVTLATIEFRGD